MRVQSQKIKFMGLGMSLVRFPECSSGICTCILTKQGRPLEITRSTKEMHHSQKYSDWYISKMYIERSMASIEGC